MYKACSSASVFRLTTQATLLCITPKITSKYFPFNRKPVERKNFVIQEKKLTQNSNLLYTVTTKNTKRINTDKLLGKQELVSAQVIDMI